ncbi:MAG: glycosyltransferase family 4 protein [Lachnospiraceae bacterium]|nr:glycosyltransferase family 4 protein [Lachnospiraceae bacterium]
MRFVTLNPRTKNVNLVKDVGLIPYYLHTLFGVDATVVTYKNDEAYPYLDNEVKGLKIEFIKKRFGRQIDGMLYVLKNAKKIDVLNVYHLNTASLLSELAYKLMNKNGKIYLKLDMSREGLRTVLLKDLRGFIKRLDIKLADVVSCETVKILEVLKENFGEKIIYITNGCLIPDECRLNDYTIGNLDNSVNSDNTILTVANFGTWEKASDTLLDAFVKSAKDHDYKLKVIGSVAKEFKPYIDKILAENNDVADRIQFLGEIHDRKALYEEYRKAKIFTLPSRQESFGIVLVEAAYEGCYLITTEATAAGYDVSDNGRFGTIVKTDDVNDLAKAFTEICTNSEYDFNNHAKEISEYAEEVFNWEKIVFKLYEYL